MNTLSPSGRMRHLIIRLSLTLMLMQIPSWLLAQGIDAEQLIRQRSITCKDIAFSATWLLQDFHAKQQHDTIQALLSYWESHCEIQEPMMRFLILHLIETNTFNEYWYPESLPYLLENYQTSQSHFDLQHYYYDYLGMEYYPVHPDFNNYTRKLAEELKAFEDLSAVERYLLEFYSHNFQAAADIKRSGLLEGSLLYSMQQKMDTHQQQSDFRSNVTLSGGIWKPTGQLTTLGAHPEFGAAIELQKQAILMNLYVDIAFLNSPNTYQVIVKSQTYETKRFRGLAVGFDLGLQLAGGKNTAIFLFPGIAFRNFESLNTNTEEDSSVPSKTIGSFCPNIGLYLRLNTSSGKSIGIRARYNRVNFKNKGGTDLSGDIFTVGLVYGMGIDALGY